ncbi:GvpL/GvpF family gas vesicle protein [Spartinivicinus ruber]|uniref:GvpL/GvpF family gas vesicle protein n=1 Tax=Spartinivicinus ruber TaxID=2683272 RepID=UPI0013D0EEAD|nr:GvpL/GvpF family gas vesicle protein [Spartinivicinus ruber]
MARSAAELLLQNDQAIYVYGFIDNIALREEITVAGIAGFPVFIYYHQQLAAIVSKVPIDLFTGFEAEANLQNPEWLTQRAYQHEQVVEQVWQYTPIYPVGLATLFSSATQLVEQMTCYQRDIIQALITFANFDEWAVKGFLDKKQAQEKLWETTCQQHQNKLSSSAGIRHLQEQRLRREFSKQVNTWVQQTCQEVATELSILAREWCQRKVVTMSHITLNGGRQAENILNLALLVATDRQDQLLQIIEDRNNYWQNYGLQFTCNRWPPYSFCQAPFTTESLTATL